MNFLAPSAFWLLCTIPIVVVFYLLKRKRVVQLISSTILWQKYLAETQASAPFQKLRHNWLLILQILLLLLVILALSRPYFAGEAEPSRLRVVILDASASMQSTDVEPSRFEQARSEALKWVDGLRDNDQMIVMQAGAVTEVKQSATSEKAALRRALQNCEPSDGPTRLNEALKMAESLIQNQAEAEIHLFSDGAVPNLAEFENENLPLEYHPVGQGNRNLGITALDVRASSEDSSQRSIYANITNFSTNRMETEVRLYFEDQLLDARALTIGPTNSSPHVFTADQPRDGVFSVRLQAEDQLPVDDRASIVSLLPKPAKVLLVTSGNRLLARAIRAGGEVELTVTTDLTDSAEAFDLVVLDNVTPAVWPEVNVLAIRSARPDWFTGMETVEAPPIVDWKSTHPVLRHVSFGNVNLAETLKVSPPAWAVPIVEAAGQTPLILAGEDGRQRVLWVAFDTLESNWPLRISFPIFLANAVDWLNPTAQHASQLTVRAGEAFRFGLNATVTNAQVTFPDGHTRDLSVNPDASELVFADTGRQGVYRLQLGTNQMSFCVNLMDSTESDITPKRELSLGEYAQVQGDGVRRANMELWRWIALAGLAVLLFEWWFYHKRTV